MLRIQLLDVDVPGHVTPGEVHLSSKPDASFHLAITSFANHREPYYARPSMISEFSFTNAGVFSCRDIEGGHEEAINSRTKSKPRF